MAVNLDQENKHKDGEELGFQPGELISLSRPYAYVLNNAFRGLRCDYCFSKKNDLKRCSQCCFLYFCDKICQKNAWDFHKMECKCIARSFPKRPTDSLRMIAQIVFRIKRDGFDKPEDNVHGRRVSIRTLESHSNEIRKGLETCRNMTALFMTLKEYINESDLLPQNFIDIFGKMCINSFSICNGEMESIGTGLYLGASVFDHSCEPNAEVTFDGINISVRAIHHIPTRDISKVYVSYIDQLQLTKDRIEYLEKQYYFTCQCSRCSSSDSDDLLRKALINGREVENVKIKSAEDLSMLKKLRKAKASFGSMYELAMKILEYQDGILADTNFYKIKALEFAFDSCIQLSRWTEASALGAEINEPYRLLYGSCSPYLGIHLFKMGKIKNLQGLTESAIKYFQQAEAILKMTHGPSHPLVEDLSNLLCMCKMELHFENTTAISDTHQEHC